MIRYLIKRFLVAIPTFLGITLIVFILSNMAPGSPVDVLAANNTLSEEAYEQLKVSLGLDKPVLVRYGIWLGDFFQGDMGVSTRTNTPVSKVIGERVGASLLLSVSGLVFCLLISLPLGILSAYKEGSIWDKLGSVVAFLGSSLPGFFISLLMIYVFAAKLGVLPATGMYSATGSHSIGDLLAHMIMPTFVLGFTMCGEFIKQIKGSMLEVLSDEHVKTARSKGLRERVVVMKHVFRNSLMPLITLISLTVPFLLGGAVVTEQVFGWPGLGSLMVLSINSRDYNAIMGVTVFIAAGVLICNVILDLVYAKLDPRIRN